MTTLARNLTAALEGISNVVNIRSQRLQQGWRWISEPRSDQRRIFLWVSLVATVFAIPAFIINYLQQERGLDAANLNNEMTYMATCYIDNMNNQTRQWCDQNKARTFHSEASLPHWLNWRYYLPPGWCAWSTFQNEQNGTCIGFAILVATLLVPDMIAYCRPIRTISHGIKLHPATLWTIIGSISTILFHECARGNRLLCIGAVVFAVDCIYFRPRHRDADLREIDVRSVLSFCIALCCYLVWLFQVIVEISHGPGFWFALYIFGCVYFMRR